MFLNSPRRAPSLGRRASIPLLCPTAPPEASFLGVGRQRLVRWRWRQSLTQPVHRSSYQREGGQVEGTKNTSAKQGSVCFSKLHAAPLFATGFGQLTISHIKQQAPSLQLRTECSSKVTTKRLRFVASFSIHFEPRFEPLGWLCALYSSAAGRKNLSWFIPMTKIRAPLCRLN